LSPSSHDRQEWPGHGLRPWERARWPTPNGRRPPPSSWTGWAHLPGRRAPFDDDRRLGRPGLGRAGAGHRRRAAPVPPAAGGLHRCQVDPSLRPLLVADPTGQRRDPSQPACGDQAPRRTTRKTKPTPGRCWQRTPLRQQAAAIIAPGSCDQGGRCTTCKAAVEVEGLHRVGRLEPRRPTRRLKRVIHRLGSARCAVWG
jgi:hypothetical protein